MSLNTKQVSGLDAALAAAGGGGGASSVYHIHRSGTLRLQTPNTWVGMSKKYEGPTSHFFDEEAGSGTRPNLNWRSLGDHIRSGYRIVDMGIDARLFRPTTDVNHSATTESVPIDDLEFNLQCMTSYAPDLSGADQVWEVEYLRPELTSLWKAPVGLTAITGPLTKRYRRVLPIGLDLTTDAFATLFVRAKNWDKSDGNDWYVAIALTLTVEAAS